MFLTCAGNSDPRDGSALFENMYGDFAPDRRVAVASASKLGMEAGGIAAGATEFSLTLAQGLQPLITAELAD
jgi:hypothetical protein